MQIVCFFRRLVIMAIFAYASVTPIRAGADSSGAGIAPTEPPKAQPGDLAGRSPALGLRYHVRIVVDPEIPAVPVEAPEKDVSITSALNSLARQIPHVVWRRIYVDKDADLPTPAKLAATARALERLPSRELAVENPMSHRTVFFLPHSQLPAAAPALQESVLADKPVYLFYTAMGAADGLTAAERLGDLQDQYLDLLSRVPAAVRPNPALAGMRMLQNMDTSQRESFMRKAYEAGTQAWQNTDSTVRDEMVQQFIQTVQQTASPSQNPGDDTPAGVSERASQNHYEELRRITDAMARHYRVRIVIEPSLWLTEQAHAPSYALSLEQALDAVIASGKEIVWRRLYCAQSAAAPLPPKEAAASARALELSFQTELGIESPSSPEGTLLQASNTSVSLHDALLRNRLSVTPTYVVYARHTARSESISPGQRLAELQQLQADVLTHMSSEQLAQIMTGQVEQYQDLNANSRSSVMHLPVSAMLMAVWMPRKALEKGAPAPP